MLLIEYWLILHPIITVGIECKLIIIIMLMYSDHDWY